MTFDPEHPTVFIMDNDKSMPWYARIDLPLDPVIPIFDSGLKYNKLSEIMKNLLNDLIIDGCEACSSPSIKVFIAPFNWKVYLHCYECEHRTLIGD